MRLQRVQIPNFRVLKDIDITFEKHHTPQIFPLASQNGGGKSTFLQLVFTLLIGYIGGDKSELIENLLKNSGINWFLGSSKLSTVTLTDDMDTIEIDFEFCTISTLCDAFTLELDNEIYKDYLDKLKELGINNYDEFHGEIKNSIQAVKTEIQSHKIAANDLAKTMTKPSTLLKGTGYSELSSFTKVGDRPSGFAERKRIISTEELDKIEVEISNLKKKLNNLEASLQNANIFLSEFHRILLLKGINILSSQNNIVLVSKLNGSDNLSFADLSKKLFRTIFIAASSSQVFLFLSPEELSSLFRETSDYYEVLRGKRQAINNLFLYDFSMVKVLIDAFKKALDNDRVQAIRSGGDHGNEFKILFNDLKDFLDGKIIQPSEDMSKIIIKQRDRNGQEIELSPADLSHGELRRLSLYAWLKINKIKNSIVLIDEIEIGLHPDWQYQIVRDLEEWEPSNQYILATHSYEICSALSPAHVKEIEPKLLKSEAKTAQ